MKLSIIIPVFNARDTIARAIESVIQCTNISVEIVIIDGKSTDGTCDIVSLYSKYIEYYISEEDAGIYDAMNKGIRAATGDLIAFLGADDEYISDGLDSLVGEFQLEKFDAYWAPVLMRRGTKIIKCEKINMDILPYGMPGCHQGLFVKRSLFERYGLFSLSYKIGADYDWIYNAFRNGMRIKIGKNPVAIYNIQGASSMNLMQTYGEHRLIALNYSMPNRKISVENYYAITNRKKVIVSERILNELRKNTIYVFGTGAIGEECITLLENNHIKNFLCVDNDPAKQGKKINGHKIISASELEDVDFVIIASTLFEDEIENQILKKGLSRKKMLKYSDLKRMICDES